MASRPRAFGDGGHRETGAHDHEVRADGPRLRRHDAYQQAPRGLARTLRRASHRLRGRRGAEPSRPLQLAGQVHLDPTALSSLALRHTVAAQEPRLRARDVRPGRDPRRLLAAGASDLERPLAAVARPPQRRVRVGGQHRRDLERTDTGAGPT